MNSFKFENGCAEKLNRLAREEAKKRILQDILFDLAVCEIEGWSKTEYIKELKALLDSIAKNIR